MQFITKRPEYNRWYNIKTRCYNTKDRSYKWYGAKGVTMCDEWLNDYYAFESWIFSQANYSQEMQVSRFGDTGNYSPENCRLLTKSENSREVKSKRGSKRTMCLETGEVFDSTAEAAKYLGLHRGAVCDAASGKNKTAAGLHWVYI